MNMIKICNFTKSGIPPPIIKRYTIAMQEYIVRFNMSTYTFEGSRQGNEDMMKTKVLGLVLLLPDMTWVNERLPLLH